MSGILEFSRRLEEDNNIKQFLTVKIRRRSFLQIFIKVELQKATTNHTTLCIISKFSQVNSKLCPYTNPSHSFFLYSSENG